ncbi:uncharacterized protein BP01DRAFT_361523 [Aspergillus saccharolyticus JOP 1030-1]|uniref:Uncharacterized protein n=1 Tax=Aspergillus saccharolyticus JOP 1030-1 TaxID=1450539 RepID=A0A318Z5W7_9EURO|nr:hypothetical protein BP01DRAFT_361523 [Aspergillus saccharolyticus JOP 1030-1]PYH40133.1 hypothetical protein BP01DRAFT_361523 [Aspergillus saccharolyticus JOP 1030-1]
MTFCARSNAAKPAVYVLAERSFMYVHDLGNNGWKGWAPDGEKAPPPFLQKKKGSIMILSSDRPLGPRLRLPFAHRPLETDDLSSHRQLGQRKANGMEIDSERERERDRETTGCGAMGQSCGSYTVRIPYISTYPWGGGFGDWFWTRHLWPRKQKRITSPNHFVWFKRQ